MQQRVFGSNEVSICHLWKPKYVKLRYDIFCKRSQSYNLLNSYKSIDMSLLPPHRDSIVMHVRCVKYQLYIWRHVHVYSVDLPDIDDSEWKVWRGEMQYEWTSGAIVS